MIENKNPNDPDHELMHAIQQGDHHAFGIFFDRHSPGILGLITRIVGPNGGAEDVLQDVFTETWRKKDQFDSQRGDPIAWLILIARSRALDRRRRLAREADRPQTVSSSEWSETAADQAEKAEAAAQANLVLSALPPEQRELIHLSFYDGLSHSEIADRTNIALGTVKSRIRTGIRDIRRSLVGCEG